MKMKVIRSVPQKELYFTEETVPYNTADPSTEGGVVNLFDEFEYQTVLGFGAAFTEAAAYNYSLLSEEQKKDFLEKYFDRKKGIGYNFGRTHISSCDFSLDIYHYVQDGDKTLETFSIDRDRKYIIPFVKDALAYCEEEIVLFASPWSPPAYMKDNESPIGGGSLKEEYKELWARYYARYIKEFAKEGIKISAITVQNEPIASQTWESCYYTPEDERDFIEKYLAPVLDDEGLSDIKIIIWDHNKERVYDRAKAIFSSKAVEDRVWAVGHHWYTGDHFDGMRLVHEKFGKPIISTENCEGITRDPVEAAERYAREICGDFNNFTGAFCDWNILLNQYGGPYHNRYSKPVTAGSIVYEDKGAGCRAPVLYDEETKELNYTPTYYYVGHFSKYVERGAKRVATTKYCDQIQSCGFKNPDGTLVVVVMNMADEALPVNLRHEGGCTALELEAHSIMTVLLEQE